MGARLNSCAPKTDLEKRKGRLKRVKNRLANVTIGKTKLLPITDYLKRTKRGSRTDNRLPGVAHIEQGGQRPTGTTITDG